MKIKIKCERRGQRPRLSVILTDNYELRVALLEIGREIANYGNKYLPALVGYVCCTCISKGVALTLERLELGIQDGCFC